MAYFRLETETYTASGHSIQKLDISQNIKRLMLEFDMTYNTGASVTRIYDGFAMGGLDSLVIRDGADVPIKMYGYDIQWLAQLLNKMPHGWTQLTTTTSQTGQTSENKFILPIELNRALYRKPVIELNWGTDSHLGTGYTISNFTMNGSYELTNQPVAGFKVIPDISKTGVTATQYIDILPEGALQSILVIARANASPKARRDALSIISVKIEETYWEIDADTGKNEYSKITQQAENTGLYLLDFTETRPIVGNNSKLELDGDATATDYNVYFIYVPSGAPPEPKPVETVRPELKRLRGPFLRGLPRFPVARLRRFS